ncbi:MAG: serine/threonine protein phosphatase [Bacteroidia bacterium]|nr:serine/threonine protein phosphatase [Bacteroidia bacterium]
MRRIAISDIHGCVKTFRSLLEDQVVLSKDDQLYLLGDYVDRGPDSKGVLDYIMELTKANYNVRCLRGNHEEMMYKAAKSPNEAPLWLVNGGQQTLASFGVDDPASIPAKYLEFIEGLEYFAEVDNLIFVHAGLNFKGNSEENRESGFLWRMHNPMKDLDSMMWIRWWYNDIDWHWLRDRIIVHGHTPQGTDEIWDMYDNLSQSQVIDIDNGCFARNHPGMGQLCAFDATNMDLFFQENID